MFSHASIGSPSSKVRTPFARLLATVLACALVVATTVQATDSRNTTTLESGVDPSISPGDDFFAFANGAWLKATELADGKERVTARTEINELTNQQIANLLNDARTAPAGSSARKVADFRAALLNVDAIKAKGIAPLKPLLDRVDRVNDKQALTRFLGSELRTDVDPLNLGIYNASHLLGLAVQASIHGEKTYVAFLLQGGLGLPDREHYVSNEPRMQLLRAKYLAYIERMLALRDAGRAPVGSAATSAQLSQRASAVMALQTAIAQSHATREASGNDRNADTLWTRADFAREAPGMDWSAFFTAAGLAKQPTFVAWQPSALKGAAALVASVPLQTWKDYLRLRVIDRYADVLPRAIADEASALRAAASEKPQSSRDLRAVEATQSAMSNAIGKMYVERHFPAAHKARVQAIAANVVTALRERVAAVTWLSPSSKAVAQAKLQAMYFGVGYPEKWQDYSSLVINPTDPVGNLLRVNEYKYQQALLRLGKNIDQREWTVAAQWPGAVLTFHQNAHNFAAALLQIPKFEATYSEAMNYGAIGAIIGHEASHFVDMERLKKTDAMKWYVEG